MALNTEHQSGLLHIWYMQTRYWFMITQTNPHQLMNNKKYQRSYCIVKYESHWWTEKFTRTPGKFSTWNGSLLRPELSRSYRFTCREELLTRPGLPWSVNTWPSLADHPPPLPYNCGVEPLLTNSQPSWQLNWSVIDLPQCGDGCWLVVGRDGKFRYAVALLKLTQTLINYNQISKPF